MRGIEHIKSRSGDGQDNLEEVLLNGQEFSHIAGIANEDLENTVDIVLNRVKNTSEEKEANEILNSVENDFIKEEKKLTRALERLEDLYLFSDTSIPEKDYLIKKQELESSLKKLRNEFKSEYEEKKLLFVGDLSFIEKTTKYLVLENVISEDVNYVDMISCTDKNVIKDYINTVIEDIVVDDKKVLSITFKNGMTHRFIYK